MSQTQPPREIQVVINGQDWRRVYEFAQARGPQAVEAFTRGFMRLMEMTTALATNAGDGGDLRLHHAFVHITADNWGFRAPVDSMAWAVHLVERLPALHTASVHARRVMNGGLIHFGPKEAIASDTVDITRLTGAAAMGQHDWSIHT